MSNKTTHVRVNKELLSNQKEMFPDYSPNEVYKMGFNLLKGVVKMNDFLYGKRPQKNEKNK